jgi:hypothetical protein
MEIENTDFSEAECLTKLSEMGYTLISLKKLDNSN